MANYTKYEIIAPSKIIRELDDGSCCLLTKAGMTPVWFSGYSFNTTILDDVLYFNTHSHNRDFLKTLSAVCPDDIIHVVSIDDFDSLNRVSLWKDGYQLLQFVEDAGGFNDVVAEHMTNTAAYKKLLDGTWKEIFDEELKPREVDENTLEVTVTLDGPFGSSMDATGMITVTQNPLHVRIH